MKGSNPVVCGRRFCNICGRWRHIVDFGVDSRTRRGTPITFSSKCRVCDRNQKRVKKGALPRAVGSAPRELRLEWRRLNTEEKRKNAAWLEERREYHRIYNEVRRRKAGVPPRHWVSNKRGDTTDPLIPVSPLAAAVEASGVPRIEVARRIGWFLPGGLGDERRMAAQLGLGSDQRQRIRYRRAVEIAKAIDIPVPEIDDVIDPTQAAS
jgi:hypothetical protein